MSTERRLRFLAPLELWREFHSACGGHHRTMGGKFQAATDEVLKRKSTPRPEHMNVTAADAHSTALVLREDQWKNLDSRKLGRGELSRYARKALEVAVAKIRKDAA